MRKHRVFTGAGLAGVLTLALAAPSLAAAEEGISVSDTEQVIAAIATVSPESMDDLAQVESGGEGAVSFAEGETEVEIPESTEEPVALQNQSAGIEVELPFAEEASPAEVGEDGIVVFDNQNGSATVPVVHDDGSVQIHTVIEGPAAPTRYDYTISIPEGGEMTVDESGVVLITDADGSFIGGAASAWARDAAGNELPTRYETNGSTLTQVVEHSSEAIYPVVADPWLGVALIQRTQWKNQTLQVFPTTYGRALVCGRSVCGAPAIARGAAWDEVRIKTAGTREDTPSMRDQFYCHWDVVRSYDRHKTSWNLDLWRPHISYARLVAARCNN